MKGFNAKPDTVASTYKELAYKELSVIKNL